MERDRTVTALVAVVLFHLAVTLAHGWTHTVAHVPLSGAAMVFVIVVNEIGPLGGLLWMRTNPRAGAQLIATTMVGSLVFGAVNHFLIPGADRVDAVTGPMVPWFEMTAALLASLELGGAVLAIAYVWRTARRLA